MKTIHHPYLATLLLSVTAQTAGAERLVDPTRPATARAAETTQANSDVKVEAIMNSGALAIVNGKVVRAGDSVGAIQIEAIMSDGVRYKRDGRSQVAHVGKPKMQVRRNVTAHGDST